MTRRKKKILLLTLLVFLIINLAFVSLTNVSTDLTEADIEYSRIILKSNRLDTLRSNSFETEVELIKRVQQSVFKIAPINKGIKHKNSREPKDLYEMGYGLCYDRSRVIEKLLNSVGFETRHIFAFRKSNNMYPDLLTSGMQSHAFSEVLTSKGWMFIDSNDSFLGFTSKKEPVSIEEVRVNGYKHFNWNAYNDTSYLVLYKKDFGVAYGLYSRHGYFYPPYNALPDIAWSQVLHNF